MSAPAHRKPDVRVTDDGTKRLILVTVPVLVDPDVYRTEYGVEDEPDEYTDEVAKAAVAEQFRLLGWGRVPTEDEGY
jgi:hypothetical protein